MKLWRLDDRGDPEFQADMEPGETISISTYDDYVYTATFGLLDSELKPYRNKESEAEKKAKEEADRKKREAEEKKRREEEEAAAERKRKEEEAERKR